MAEYEQRRLVNLEDLDEDQRRAATAPRGPVCILAGAGTGKTRTITYRIAHMVDQGLISPQRVLAVTFTNRAAGEMRERLHTMGIGGVQARTFHAAAHRQLSYFWPQVVGDLPWQLLSNKFPVVGRAVRSAGIDSAKDMVRDILSEIEWAKASCLSPEGYVERSYEIQRSSPVAPEQIAEVYRRYENLKLSSEGAYLDFDDLLVHVAGALENSPGVAEEFRGQYRSFVVDEYQDVTPLQQRVLDAWLGQRDDLTVVGDANQTIYSFTGASPQPLLDFSRRFPHAVVTTLQRDYRSTPQITDLANTVIAQARGRAAGTRLELQGMRPHGPEPTFEEYDSEESEAQAVAAAVVRLLAQGIKASEIAILYRINAQSEAFETALADAGVVYQVRGGEGFFARPEIREAMNQLVRAANRQDLPDDPVAIAQAAFAPLGLSAQEPQGAQARERWQSLRALLDLIRNLAAGSDTPGLPGIIEQLRQRAAAKHSPTMEGVTLATLHAAKGLEWDAVFIVGLTEKLLPINHAIKADNLELIEEERRLFYVGITRARVHLMISWALAKNPGARANRQRSRFLDGIAPQEVPAGAGGRAARSYRPMRCRVCRRELTEPADKVLGRHSSCAGGGDDEVFAALRSWRAMTAKAAQVPAYVIFSDATLRAMAEDLPSTLTELADISGVGPHKLERFGHQIVEIIAATRSTPDSADEPQ